MDHSLSRNNHMICPLAGFKIIFPIVYPAPMGDPARSSASRAARISSSVIRFAGRSAPFRGPRPQAQNRLDQTGCQSAVQDRRRRCAAARQQSLQRENLQDTQRRRRWVGNVPAHLSH